MCKPYLVRASLTPARNTLLERTVSIGNLAAGLPSAGEDSEPMGKGTAILGGDAASVGAEETGKRKRKTITWFGKKASFPQISVAESAL